MKINSYKRTNGIKMKWDIIFNLILTSGALLVVFPVLLVVIISFSSTRSIDEIGYNYFPIEWSLEGYRYVFEMGEQLVDSYLVTIAYAVVGTVLSLAVMSLYAYVLCQKTFWLQRGLTWFLFFTMLFSGGMLPSYMINSGVLHLNDTFWILVLPSLVKASWVIILRTFIKSTIPDSLFDAARVDGAGHFRIFGQIVLPLYKAGLGTIGLFSFVEKWNDWFTGMLYITNPKLVPLQTLLTKLQKNVDFMKNNTELASTPDGLEMMKKLPTDNLRMAILILAIVPVLFAYPCDLKKAFRTKNIFCKYKRHVFEKNYIFWRCKFCLNIFWLFYLK